MRPKKILFVVPLPPPWAGVEQMSQLLINSPVKDRFSVDLLKSNVRASNAAKGAWNISGILRVAGIATHLAYRLIARRPSVVYLTLSQNGTGFARDLCYLSICRMFRVPAVAHLHGSQLGIFLLSLPSMVRRICVRMLGTCRVIVVCSNAIRADLQRFLPTTEIRVVYNAVPPGSEPSKHGDGRSPVVSFMGHLSKAKGFYDLLLAAEELLKASNDVRFEFAGERLDVERNVRATENGAGDGVSWQMVERLRRTYPGRFQFHGILTGPEKSKFFKRADVFALPSHAEAFPVSVLEAMRSGLPLVVTRVGALPEVLTQEKNCLFVQSGNVAELASALKKLLSDAGLRERMGRQNGTDAARFSVNAFSDAMSAVFDSAAAR